MSKTRLTYKHLDIAQDAIDHYQKTAPHNFKEEFEIDAARAALRDFGLIDEAYQHEQQAAELARLRAELEQARADLERKNGWQRVALYWRNEARFYIRALIGDGYLSRYISLGSQSRRRSRKAEQSGQQAGE